MTIRLESRRSEDMTASDSELVSVRTLSRLFDISQKTIWDWIYKSRRQPTLDPLPYYKLGGLVRFNLRDVRAWVDRRKVRPTPMVGDMTSSQS
jgi:predicted DNA-binding transcriptional regulator AlpA